MVFALIYFLEIVIKVYVFGCVKFATGKEKWWNWFDVAILIVVAIGIIMEIIASQVNVDRFLVLRTIRMVRIFRVFRVFQLSIFQELMAMCRGLVSGCRTLASAS